MADSTNTQATEDKTPQAGEQSTTAQGDASGFKPIATQEELDRIVTSRLAREREKYAGFEDIKAKAKKYDESQDAAKSELQKLQERAEAAEKKAAGLEAAWQLSAWKREVAEATGIPLEVAEALGGATKEELEASAKVVKAVMDKDDKDAEVSPIVSGLGDKGGGAAPDTAQMFASAIKDF